MALDYFKLVIRIKSMAAKVNGIIFNMPPIDYDLYNSLVADQVRIEKELLDLLVNDREL